MAVPSSGASRAVALPRVGPGVPTRHAGGVADHVALPPTGLPVEDVVDQVRGALNARGAAVLVAPPGAGKTTVVPLRLLGEPALGGGSIVVLEPRRLAARAAARRMADLLGEPVGRTVGYRTRDEKVVSRDTRIEVITEGILVRRLQTDPTLPGTGLVVLDEVHERNLVTDLSLALLLDARRGLRPDLAVLAMSATVAADRFATVIGGDDGPATVVRSDGRQHPVEIAWWPAGPRDRPEQHVARAVTRALGEHGVGDVLVFLPGAREIHRVGDLLRGSVGPGMDVRPLFGALAPAEQDVALAPSPPGRRRVVLATDIAESSLTVDGVRIVVDAGLVRSPRYDAATGLTRLVTGPASQAATDQRAGRAGRVAPGVAVRVWTEAEHRRRATFPEPEIVVVDLAGLVLEVAVWGSRPEDLPFLDPPPERAWADATALLHEIGAIDAAGRPTETGRRMIGLPVHPRLARLAIDGQAQGAGWAGSVLAAMLEERDVLGGRRDDRSADLAERVSAIANDDAADARRPASAGSGANVSRDAVRLVRRRAKELAKRIGAKPGQIDLSAIGPLVALAYPDRVAQARGGGRFRLRDGGGGELPATDPLAGAPFLAVADVDGGTHHDRGSADGRIRMAAALDLVDVVALMGDRAEVTSTVLWDSGRNDLRARTETRAGALILASTDGPAPPGLDTIAALIDRVRSTEGDLLPWTDGARALQSRLSFLHTVDPGRWPDVSDTALLNDLETWLAPQLARATGRRDVERIDVVRALRASLDYRGLADVDRLAPRTIALASGREVAVRYDNGTPTIFARVQDLYGITRHPTVLDGRVPVVVHLLSPAGRPVQVTADLPGFWAGTWKEVRKEMAGRYPRHDWPLDPATAAPGRRPARRKP